jgi:FixJ family two-component response regulator
MITIIDDDESVRRALRRLIKSLGLNVETFATPEEFLEGLIVHDSQAEVLAPAPARCLILDVHLPGLSGLELQRRLNAEAKNVPIVFITAYPDDRARDQAMQAGAVAFLYKPFEEQALLNAVEKGLTRSRESEVKCQESGVKHQTPDSRFLPPDS